MKFLQSSFGTSKVENMELPELQGIIFITAVRNCILLLLYDFLNFPSVHLKSNAAFVNNLMSLDSMVSISIANPDMR